MTKEQIDAIRARLDAATPGPWEARQWYGNDDGGWAAIGPHHESRDWNDDEPESDLHELAKRDAALIANAPADLRALLDEVERLTKREDELVKQVVAQIGFIGRQAEWREDAFKRGAEAMRESAAQLVHQEVEGWMQLGLSGDIRALPMPEDKS
jgi:hypothetical protein